MPFDKADELMLVELRGEAPLVRTLREFEGYDIGTLGCIIGVDGPFLKVRFAGSNEPAFLLAREVKDIE